MKYISNVGLTHYSANEMGPDFICERSAMYFAPGHIQQRASDWGPGEFEKRAFAFSREAAMKSRAWLTIRKVFGAGAIERAYSEVRDDETPADTAWLVGF